eukprot:TRINITY_DN77305_c0_g1_i1.p1 TRINITY_DN77305_c0_g1~~TRINITY_DN77305_c0_g1_i1.p1  ORF type:complete len:262 (-),score=23.65 TRINITY_DN77305_c0_g1_i1:503-1261(-)
MVFVFVCILSLNDDLYDTWCIHNSKQQEITFDGCMSAPESLQSYIGSPPQMSCAEPSVDNPRNTSHSIDKPARGEALVSDEPVASSASKTKSRNARARKKKAAKACAIGETLVPAGTHDSLDEPAASLESASKHNTFEIDVHTECLEESTDDPSKHEGIDDARLAVRTSGLEQDRDLRLALNTDVNSLPIETKSTMPCGLTCQKSRVFFVVGCSQPGRRKRARNGQCIGALGVMRMLAGASGSCSTLADVEI